MKKFKVKPPTIHDIRATLPAYNEDSCYICDVVKSVNPHLSPKESIAKLFPSARVVVTKPEKIKDVAYQCNKNGCDFIKPILTLSVYSSSIDNLALVVSRVACKPVLSCPVCMNQDVEIYKETKK